MNIESIKNYHFYDFVEYYLGYSIRGSGKIVQLDRANGIVVLKFKHFKMSSVLKYEFVFDNEKCLLSKNYWSNQDITNEWENFMQNEFCRGC